MKACLTIARGREENRSNQINILFKAVVIITTSHDKRMP